MQQSRDNAFSFFYVIGLQGKGEMNVIFAFYKSFCQKKP